ncbi:hypothetical protein H0H87_002329 [Tephrocybe sp. NHM501043]|nr:hypothetical protein H0H87_002329 [Tephrocybe sp. NHM501043]
MTHSKAPENETWWHSIAATIKCNIGCNTEIPTVNFIADDGAITYTMQDEYKAQIIAKVDQLGKSGWVVSIEQPEAPMTTQESENSQEHMVPKQFEALHRDKHQPPMNICTLEDREGALPKEGAVIPDTLLYYAH